MASSEVSDAVLLVVLLDHADPAPLLGVGVSSTAERQANIRIFTEYYNNRLSPLKTEKS